MSDVTNVPGLWERLRANEAHNREAFRRAELSPEQVSKLHCRSCHNLESALFWSPQGQSGRTLHLECPVCGGDRVRYHIGKNRVSREGRLFRAAGTGSIAVLTVGLGVLALLLFTPAGRDLIDSTESELKQHLAEMAGAVPANRGTELSIPAPVASAPSRGGSPEFVIPNPFAQSDPAELEIYIAEGDRREDVPHIVAQLVEPHGPGGAEIVREVQYLEELDQTRLVLAGGSRLWADHLEKEGTWRSAGL